MALKLQRIQWLLVLSLIILGLVVPAADSRADSPQNPVQFVEAAATVRLGRGEQRLLVSKHRIRRIATSDQSVAAAMQHGGSELSLIGRSPGACDLFVWFADDERNVVHLVIDVR